jgi:hypothetical protein
MVSYNQHNIEASIGLSRKWDAREAGREVARSAIKKLNQPPSFFLLFSTIHYKDHGGFQEFLNGVWEVLPKGTPVVGGTVAGFINNNGCYTMGATALAVSYPNIDVAIGIGKHVKRNPKNATKNCVKTLKRELKNSKFKNKFLINLISSPTIPKVPIFGRINIIKSKLVGSIITHIGVRLFSYTGGGYGKEEDVVNYLAFYLPDYYIVGGSTVDQGKMLSSYQFVGSKVYTNSVVALGCCVDLPIYLDGLIGAFETNKEFQITKTIYKDRIAAKIDNQPAKKRFFELIGFPEEIFKDLEAFYYKTGDYYPIAFDENKEDVRGIGAIYGNDIVFTHRMPGNHARFLSISGKEIIKSIDTLIKGSNTSTYPFAMIFSSAAYSFILRERTFDIKKIMDELFGGTPYLLAFPMFENIRILGKDPSVRTYSSNMISFGAKIEKDEEDK